MQIVEAVCGMVALPVAVKLTPYLSSIGHCGTALGGEPVGLVLFNRLLEPDIDLSAMKMTDRLELSEPEEMRLQCYGCDLSGRTKASRRFTGVADIAGVVKYFWPAPMRSSRPVTLPAPRRLLHARS